MTSSISRPGIAAQRAAERADDAGGHGAFEAEGIADGDHELPDAHLPGIAERHMGQAVAMDAQHGEIGVRIVADEIGRQRAAIHQRRHDAGGAVDHMAVGEQEPSGVKITPEPEPTGRSCGSPGPFTGRRDCRCTTAGDTRSTAPVTARE